MQLIATQNATITPIRERRESFSPGETARMHGLSTGLIRAEIARGNLRASRIGRRIVISRESIEAWLASNQIETYRAE
jgi:excisionase family DNA binding protein